MTIVNKIVKHGVFSVAFVKAIIKCTTVRQQLFGQEYLENIYIAWCFGKKSAGGDCVAGVFFVDFDTATGVRLVFPVTGFFEEYVLLVC